MRLILYLGKGGVGKTTLSAATAARSAQLGKRTLVVSTDLAHSLADALDHQLTAEPTQISENLWAQEINVLEEMRNGWSKVQDYITNTLKKQGANDVAAEEMALIPGMDEIVALLNIHRQAREGNFDVVVVDAAPTGETVRLLSMPETFLWYVNRANGWRNVAFNAAKPLLRSFLPGVNLFEQLDKLNVQVAALKATLTDNTISSYRLVVNPEKMVIKEALRAETYLTLYGYPIDSVLCNRILPGVADAEAPASQPGVFGEMVAQQRGYYQQIHQTFAPLPVWDAPHRSREVIGVAALAQLGADIWGDQDPTQVFFKGQTQELVKRGDQYILRLPLPHIEMGKVEMVKKGDDLIVEVGNFKRNIALPTVLAPLDATVARMVNGALEVTFEIPEASVAQRR
ncbi:MAG TPA: TRC40/GET3/ArsA family transport-energizing ATPase [Ktedonobacterales bacterium]|jgi:arsenite-transporting ATPase|nr:TRC40/GET3/ArsA family transport-energizing ATPase [Ktedonobacterales bacterium]